MSDEHHEDEGKLASTWQNQAAGRALRAARSSMGEGGSKQAAFAARLTRQLGYPVSVSSLSNWENARRTVPAPILVEAALSSGTSLDALLGEAGTPEVTTWAESLGFSKRLADLETQLAQVLERLREDDFGDTLAKVVQVLDEAGLWHGAASAQDRHPREAANG